MDWQSTIALLSENGAAEKDRVDFDAQPKELQ